MMCPVLIDFLYYRFQYSVLKEVECGFLKKKKDSFLAVKNFLHP